MYVINTNNPRGARIDCHLRTVLQMTFSELAEGEGDTILESILKLRFPIVQSIFIILFSI